MTYKVMRSEKLAALIARRKNCKTRNRTNKQRLKIAGQVNQLNTITRNLELQQLELEYTNVGILVFLSKDLNERVCWDTACELPAVNISWH